jgi:hypothetical protein
MVKKEVGNTFLYAVQLSEAVVLSTSIFLIVVADNHWLSQVALAQNLMLAITAFVLSAIVRKRQVFIACICIPIAHLLGTVETVRLLKFYVLPIVLLLVQ